MATSNTTTKLTLSLNKSKKGQSVIEFAVVSMLFVSMLFVSYNAVMAFAFQQYVSHAVFMAARSYQAAHLNPPTQESAAKLALTNYLPGLDSGKVRLGNSSIRADIVSVEVPEIDPDVIRTGSGTPANYGATIKVVFEMPLAALPLGQGDWNSIKKIRLEASSFLGREPTQAECINYFTRLLGELTIPNAPTYHKNAMQNSDIPYAMTDNGC